MVKIMKEVKKNLLWRQKTAMKMMMKFFLELQCINEEADPVNEQAKGAVTENEAPEDEEVENQATEPELVYVKCMFLGIPSELEIMDTSLWLTEI